MVYLNQSNSFSNIRKKGLTCLWLQVGVRVQRQSMCPSCRTNHSHEVKQSHRKHGASFFRWSNLEYTSVPTENFTYISSAAIHHNLINTLSSHPVSSLMVWTRWIRRHRHNLGDPVNSAAAYLCLYREA